MCRLFGMHAGSSPVRATYWLLDADDSLRAQGLLNPDGTGLGWFDPQGSPHVDKQPIASEQDAEFATRAQQAEGTTFVAHVRYATTGELAERNTHPFELAGRIFAHNGAVGDLGTLDARLAAISGTDLVAGETDSERVFALITREIDHHGGDVEAGLVAALTWLGENLPVLALNIVLATAHDLWAVRWPATHELWVWEWVAADGPARVTSRRIGAEPHTRHPAVIIATERMTADENWRLLEPGEVLRVNTHLEVTSSQPLGALRHPLRLADLEPGLAAAMKA